MSEWKIKRFWAAAAPVAQPGGFGVALDGRPVRTPAKQPLLVPSAALAEALAAEWMAQEGLVDPESMPLTRLANSALDKVVPQRAEVAAMLAEYGAHDLLCYRAERPQDLIDRQASAWDPLLDWAREALEVALHPQTGLMPLAQPESSLAQVARRTDALDAFELTAFHEFVTISGSWVIGMAALMAQQPLEALFEASHLDELWQKDQWGSDELAEEARALRRAAFETASRFAALTKG